MSKRECREREAIRENVVDSYAVLSRVSCQILCVHCSDIKGNSVYSVNRLRFYGCNLFNMRNVGCKSCVLTSQFCHVLFQLDLYIYFV